MPRIHITHKETAVNLCSECPARQEEEDTLGNEAYTTSCKTNHIEFNCTMLNRTLGMLDWKGGKWVGSYNDEIPNDCPLDKEQ